MNAMPENVRASRGTFAPSSSATSVQGIALRSRAVAKYAGPSERACLNMATGFISRHFRALLLCGLLVTPAAWATQLTLVGVFGDKAAIIAVDGGEPRTVRIGQRLGAVLLVSIEGDRATVEVDGKRRVLLRGQTYSTATSASDRQVAVLSAVQGGHFIAEGQINGGSARFLVDTGATSIALPGSEAKRLGIDYQKGRRGVTQTAAGPTGTYIVTLDTVRVGGIELQRVEAVVIEQGLNVILLGMSFLNRVEMKREGQTMTLTRRF
jgi:aspartyl protease family protein